MQAPTDDVMENVPKSKIQANEKNLTLGPLSSVFPKLWVTQCNFGKNNIFKLSLKKRMTTTTSTQREVEYLLSKWVYID